MRTALATAVAACLLAACSSETLERMETQEKYQPYSANGLFEDGRAMRPLPAGTVPRERLRFRTVNRSGVDETGTPLASIPIPMTPQLLAKGRKRYDIVCATCHGVVGDGNSVVARNMAQRPPPSLHLPAYANRPPGYFFQVITEGYGLMPSYANEIPVDERWAVVAYVRALQLSQRAPLDAAPAAERARLLEAKP